MIRRMVSKTRKKKEENETFNHDLGQLDDARYASEGLVQSERFPMLSLLRKIR